MAADVSPVRSASMMQSDATSPLLSAKNTPDEYTGSMKPQASPTSVQPSPAERSVRYENSLATTRSSTCRAPSMRPATAGHLATSSKKISWGVPRPLSMYSLSPTTPTLTTSSACGMYQNQLFR